MAKLRTWIANPSTGASISGSFSAGGADVEMVTNCDVKIVAGKSLSGVGNLAIVARNITLSSSVVASGDMLLRASTKVSVPSTGTLTAASFAAEGPTVDIRGDNVAGGGFCAEAASVNTSLDCSWNLGGGDALMNATSLLNVYGDFSNGSSFTATSGAKLYHRSDSLLSAVGDVVFDAATTADMAGDITGAGDVGVVGATVTTRNTAAWTGSGGVSLESTGRAALSLSGAITTNAWIEAVSASGLTLAAGSTLNGNGDIALDVTGKFDGRGLMNENGTVLIESATWKLTSTHNFSGNDACNLVGTKLRGSVTPVGCTIGAP